MPSQLEYLSTFALQHNGDCSLLGAGADGTIYVEEIYGDGWFAQHTLSPDGAVLETVDEDSGARSQLKPLVLPADIARPQTGWHTAVLNFAGPRHRGMRDAERVADLVRSIPIQDKMALASHFRLPSPPMLLGLAESFVLAEAPLCPPDVYVVCRRVRFAYLLAETRMDADDQPYDYDTTVVYMAHLFDRTREQPDLVPTPDDRLPGVTLNRPMDCLIRDERLYVADGGNDTQPARVHIWAVARENAGPAHSDTFVPGTD